MTSLQRKNEVQYLVKYNVEQFVFEPNSQATWRKISDRLNYILAREANVEDFKVLCDSTNNGPGNDLWVEAQVKFEGDSDFTNLSLRVSA